MTNTINAIIVVPAVISAIVASAVLFPIVRRFAVYNNIVDKLSTGEYTVDEVLNRYKNYNEVMINGQ